MKKIIIMLGPPGSGKGTQAKKIAQKYNYAHISTGDLLRVLADGEQADSEEKDSIERMKNGALVDDELIYRLTFREIEKYLEKGVVLDGAVRNTAQAEKFQEFFADKGLGAEVLVIAITLSDEETLNRLTKRRVCAVCGEIIPYLKETKNINICPKCGGRLVLRKDDDEAVIKERILKQGNRALMPLLDYYEGLGILKKVDGSRSIKEVERDIELSF